MNNPAIEPAQPRVPIKRGVPLREQVLAYVNEANKGLEPERQVTVRSALIAADRALTATAHLDKHVRYFNALRAVINLVTVTQTGTLPLSAVFVNNDLLPVGHPHSTAAHAMTASAYRHARSRWHAADPRITDPATRALVAAAFTHDVLSVEHTHAMARLNALVASAVLPRDIALLAALGGNSSAAKSARAKLQRRDRLGRFAEMGGGANFKVRLSDGSVHSVTGKVAANSINSEAFDIEVKGDPNLPDGIYQVPANKAEMIEATIDVADLPENVRLKQNVAPLSDADAVDIAELGGGKQVPDGWSRNTLQENLAKKNDPNFDHELYKSDDGYVVEKWPNAKNKKLRDAMQKAYAEGLPVIAPDGKEFKPDQPFYEIRDSGTGRRVVGYSQSWADAQRILADLDKKKDEGAAEKPQAQTADNIVSKSQQSKQNLLEGKDALGREIPDGWELVKTDSQFATFKKTINGLPVYAVQDLQQPDSFQGRDIDGNYYGVDNADFDTIEIEGGKRNLAQVATRRENAKSAVAEFDPNGDIAKMIDGGASANDVTAELEKNADFSKLKADAQIANTADYPTKEEKALSRKYSDVIDPVRKLVALPEGAAPSNVGPARGTKEWLSENGFKEQSKNADMIQPGDFIPTYSKVAKDKRGRVSGEVTSVSSDPSDPEKLNVAVKYPGGGSKTYNLKRKASRDVFTPGAAAGGESPREIMDAVRVEDGDKDRAGSPVDVKMTDGSTARGVVSGFESGRYQLVDTDGKIVSIKPDDISGVNVLTGDDAKSVLDAAEARQKAAKEKRDAELLGPKPPAGEGPRFVSDEMTGGRAVMNPGSKNWEPVDPDKPEDVEVAKQNNELDAPAGGLVVPSRRVNVSFDESTGMDIGDVIGFGPDEATSLDVPKNLPHGRYRVVGWETKNDEDFDEPVFVSLVPADQATADAFDRFVLDNPDWSIADPSGLEYTDDYGGAVQFKLNISDRDKASLYRGGTDMLEPGTYNVPDEDGTNALIERVKGKGAGGSRVTGLTFDAPDEIYDEIGVEPGDISKEAALKQWLASKGIDANVNSVKDDGRSWEADLVLNSGTPDDLARNAFDYDDWESLAEDTGAEISAPNAPTGGSAAKANDIADSLGFGDATDNEDGTASVWIGGPDDVFVDIDENGKMFVNDSNQTLFASDNVDEITSFINDLDLEGVDQNEGNTTEVDREVLQTAADEFLSSTGGNFDPNGFDPENEDEGRLVQALQDLIDMAANPEDYQGSSIQDIVDSLYVVDPKNVRTFDPETRKPLSPVTQDALDNLINKLSEHFQISPNNRELTPPAIDTVDREENGENLAKANEIVDTLGFGDVAEDGSNIWIGGPEDVFIEFGLNGMMFVNDGDKTLFASDNVDEITSYINDNELGPEPGEETPDGGGPEGDGGGDPAAIADSVMEDMKDAVGSFGGNPADAKELRDEVVEAGKLINKAFSGDEASKAKNLQDARDLLQSATESMGFMDKDAAAQMSEAVSRLDSVIESLGGEGTTTPSAPNVPQAPKPTQSATPASVKRVGDLDVPDGAYRLNLEAWSPQGRTDEDMAADFTDDPKVLSKKFTGDQLEGAFVEAITGMKPDDVADFLDKIATADEDAEAEPAGKKKPGPKKKKPESTQKKYAPGVGPLPFEGGDEFVDAEALYLALQEQGENPTRIAADAYDAFAGEANNANFDKPENVTAIEPEIDQEELDLMDEIINDDLLEEEVPAREENEYEAIARTGALAMNENRRFEETNKHIVQAGKDVQDGLDTTQILTANIDLALSDDPEENAAFRAIWSMFMSIQGVEADPTSGSDLYSKLRRAVGQSGKKDFDAIIEKYSNYDDFVASRKAIAYGEEDPYSDDSKAGVFYRLIAASSTPNESTLYRAIPLAEDDPAFAEYTEPGSIIHLDPRPSSRNPNIKGGTGDKIIVDSRNGKSTVEVQYVFPPGTAESLDVSDASWFGDESEELIWGSFEIDTVTESEGPFGRKLKVTVKPLDKRNKVLSGVDVDYSELLEPNETPELPEGAHVMDPDPFIAPDEYPEQPDGVTFDPAYLARTFGTDGLAEQMLEGIRNGSGVGAVDFPVENGNDKKVPVEALRDALQIQGIDTNELVATVNDTQSDNVEPAEANVDDPLTDVIEKYNSVYDADSMEQVGGQQGSNEGGVYEDEDGNQFYLKKPKSVNHAQNEVLASAIYEALGIDSVSVLEAERDGDTVTISPMREGVPLSERMDLLNDPEFLKKIQDGFIADVLLANWDVAGLTFDNIMVDPDGNPFRVDPGGALMYRAQGAPKGTLFSDDPNELETLVDPQMNPNSAKLFGSMSEDDKRLSAENLLSLTPDQIEALVDSIVADPAAAMKLKETLVARRQNILDKFGLADQDMATNVKAFDKTVPSAPKGGKAPKAEKPAVDPNDPKAYTLGDGTKIMPGMTLRHTKTGEVGVVDRYDPGNPGYVYVKVGGGKPQVKSTKMLELVDDGNGGGGNGPKAEAPDGGAPAGQEPTPSTPESDIVETPEPETTTEAVDAKPPMTDEELAKLFESMKDKTAPLTSDLSEYEGGYFIPPTELVERFAGKVDADGVPTGERAFFEEFKSPDGKLTVRIEDGVLTPENKKKFIDAMVETQEMNDVMESAAFRLRLHNLDEMEADEETRRYVLAIPIQVVVLNNPHWDEEYKPSKNPTGLTKTYEGRIIFDAEQLEKFEAGEMSDVKTKNFGPFTASDEAGYIRHVVHHEWAHIMEPRNQETFDQDQEKINKMLDKAWSQQTPDKNYMQIAADTWGSSLYAVANASEAYAEARAEWELRGGDTGGLPILEYFAKKYDWGKKKPKAEEQPTNEIVNYDIVDTFNDDEPPAVIQNTDAPDEKYLNKQEHSAKFETAVKVLEAQFAKLNEAAGELDDNEIDKINDSAEVLDALDKARGKIAMAIYANDPDVRYDIVVDASTLLGDALSTMDFSKSMTFFQDKVDIYDVISLKNSLGNIGKEILAVSSYGTGELPQSNIDELNKEIVPQVEQSNDKAVSNIRKKTESIEGDIAEIHDAIDQWLASGDLEAPQSTGGEVLAHLNKALEQLAKLTEEYKADSTTPDDMYTAAFMAQSQVEAAQQLVEDTSTMKSTQLEEIQNVSIQLSNLLQDITDSTKTTVDQPQKETYENRIWFTSEEEAKAVKALNDLEAKYWAASLDYTPEFGGWQKSATISLPDSFIQENLKSLDSTAGIRVSLYKKPSGKFGIFVRDRNYSVISDETYDNLDSAIAGMDSYVADMAKKVEAINSQPETEESVIVSNLPSLLDSSGINITYGSIVRDKNYDTGIVVKVKTTDGYVQVRMNGTGKVVWRKADLLYSTGATNEAVQQEAISKIKKPTASGSGSGPTSVGAKKKSSKAGVPEIVVEQKADWTESRFKDIPSLASALDGVVNGDAVAGRRGTSAAVDSFDVEDLDVRLIAMTDVDGTDSVQVKFKLTDWAGNALMEELLSNPIDYQNDTGDTTLLGLPLRPLGDTGWKVSAVSVELPHLNPDGTLSLLNPSTGRVDGLDVYKSASDGSIRTRRSGASYTYVDEETGARITIHRANRDATSKLDLSKYSTSATAFHNQVVITAPADITPKQIEKLLERAGVRDPRPAEKADAQVLAENRLMSVFDSQADPSKNLSGTAREESLKRIEEKYGLTVDDVVFKPGAGSGRLEMRISEDAARNVAGITGIQAIRHTITGAYSQQNIVDTLVAMISNPAQGLLSTVARWTEGVGYSGQSSEQDVSTGGADYVFGTPQSVDYDITRSYVADDNMIILFDPAKVFQRLDMYANEKDEYGKRTKNRDTIAALSAYSPYEIMFKHRLGFEDLMKITVSAGTRSLILGRLKELGITQIGGRPIEEVILEPTGTPTPGTSI